MTTGPVYWKNEATGDLAKTIAKYLSGQELDAAEAMRLRWYLRQWVVLGDWARTNVEFGLVIDLLLQDGIDPL